MTLSEERLRADNNAVEAAEQATALEWPADQEWQAAAGQQAALEEVRVELERGQQGQLCRVAVEQAGIIDSVARKAGDFRSFS